MYLIIDKGCTRTAQTEMKESQANIVSARHFRKVVTLSKIQLYTSAISVLWIAQVSCNLSDSPLAVSARAGDGLDLEVEAPALFLIAVFLGGGLAVEGAGGAQLGQAFVLVRDGDLEREDMTDVLFPQTLLLEWEIVTNLDLRTRRQ